MSLKIGQKLQLLREQSEIFKESFSSVDSADKNAISVMNSEPSLPLLESLKENIRVSWFQQASDKLKQFRQNHKSLKEVTKQKAKDIFKSIKDQDNISFSWTMFGLSAIFLFFYVITILVIFSELNFAKYRHINYVDYIFWLLITLPIPLDLIGSVTRCWYTQYRAYSTKQKESEKELADKLQKLQYDTSFLLTSAKKYLETVATNYRKRMDELKLEFKQAVVDPREKAQRAVRELEHKKLLITTYALDEDIKAELIKKIDLRIEQFETIIKTIDPNEGIISELFIEVQQCLDNFSLGVNRLALVAIDYKTKESFIEGLNLELYDIIINDIGTAREVALTSLEVELHALKQEAINAGDCVNRFCISFPEIKETHLLS